MHSSASIAAQHVLFHLSRAARASSGPPLFVALQGPQGSGKTHLTRSLVNILSSPPHSLRLAVLSIDDLYLAHDGLVSLARDNPGNRLWTGRGQPGTHDMTLGAKVVKGLHGINAGDASSHVVLPSFDKSKFAGEGDRAAEGVVVGPPVDVVLFEGWCVGFYPLTPDELDAKWECVRVEAEGAPESIVARAMDGIRKEDIEAANLALRGYVKEWYGFFEVFVQIRPPAHTPYEYIYTWRLQQEHSMKAANGGIGMTDEQVKSFVDRYIPGYVFFGEGVRRGGTAEGRPAWEGKGIGITIDQERKVVGTEKF